MGSAPSDAGTFEVGMKLEALNPLNPLALTVASIVQILQYNNIVVKIDKTETYFICHASSGNIFPVGYAKQHKCFLTPPKGLNCFYFCFTICLLFHLFFLCFVIF